MNILIMVNRERSDGVMKVENLLKIKRAGYNFKLKYSCCHISSALVRNR